MLTETFYLTLASRLMLTPGRHRYFITVGAGDPAWDRVPPPPDRAISALVNETARLQVVRVVFLNEAGRPSRRATERLRFSVVFGPDEANGTLRECGLFGEQATRASGSGSLLSYFTFPRIEKTANLELERTINIDLTPQPFVPGTRPTRFLSNTASAELHDLENVTPNCQIDEIRFDHRFFFASVNEAVAMGYDFCAYCFGRELSER